MNAPPFVIVTPAHNEAALIERTIEAMLAQTLQPLRWVIVSDNSSDATAEIVRRHAERAGFIELVERKRSGVRDFAGKVHAFEAGLEHVAALPYRYVGNLDADIALAPDYFERLLPRFEADPYLGLAGGMVESRIGARFVSQQVAPDSVAGAVQLFRRTCFEEIGGYRALPDGGIDAAAEIMARMKGWNVRTFADLRVQEHRRTGTAAATPLAAKLREGRRFHALGYGFAFLCMRCVYRAWTPPRVSGSTAMLAGYLLRALGGAPPLLPPEVVRFLRAEQQAKLADTLRGAHVRHLRNP